MNNNKKKQKWNGDSGKILPRFRGCHCSLDTGFPLVIVREYVFFVFFQNPKKRDFLRFFEVTNQKNIENVFQVSES